MSQDSSLPGTGNLSVFRRHTEEESLFARDVGGRLIRADKATVADFDTDVRLSINGQSITVKRAVPLVDGHGVIQRAEDGQAIPRYTTIYDAATLGLQRDAEGRHPIPTLCHRDHLPPVGVCRLCMVEACETTRKGLRRQLVPACVQRVSEGMQVHTLDSHADPDAASRVKTATGLVTELLLSDHAPKVDDEDAGQGNELLDLARRLGIESSRFGRACTQRGQDFSSYVLEVNHDECILCMRCQRGCNWLKHNNVIGTAGKGYATHISFDLDQALAESNCVSCGECAASCPTDALRFTSEFLTQRLVQAEQDLNVMQKTGWFVGPAQLVQHELFRGLPHKLLELHATGVWKRKLDTGEVLCRQGEGGGTAFILCRGSFSVSIGSTSMPSRSQSSSKGQPQKRTWMEWVRQFMASGAEDTNFEASAPRIARLADWGGREIKLGESMTLEPHDVIYGEASCISGAPRSATVVAKEPSEVLEIRRNVLELLLRHHTSRPILERIYRERALDQLAGLAILANLEPDMQQSAAVWLRERVELLQVDAGQVVFSQGDSADYLYVIRMGFIKVSQRDGQLERVISYLGPGKYFGELALLSQLGNKLTWDTCHKPGTRTTTCSALDHVELFRLPGADFKELMRAFPQIEPEILTSAQRILDQQRVARQRLTSEVDEEFLKLGLYGANNLLVLDLERCTRCDECVKACADTHDGVSRLVRDGPRYDRFLIASACRSCVDPFCLAGCPVDAIHRDGTSQYIRIEDYCIGCGLCAKNCPYGCINMHGFQKIDIDSATGHKSFATQEVEGLKLPVIQQRATTCDMCTSIDGRPSCVYACPHNAAFRIDSSQLQRMVGERST